MWEFCSNKSTRILIGFEYLTDISKSHEILVNTLSLFKLGLNTTRPIYMQRYIITNSTSLQMKFLLTLL